MNKDNIITDCTIGNHELIDIPTTIISNLCFQAGYLNPLDALSDFKEYCDDNINENIVFKDWLIKKYNILYKNYSDNHKLIIDGINNTNPKYLQSKLQLRLCNSPYSCYPEYNQSHTLLHAICHIYIDYETYIHMLLPYRNFTFKSSLPGKTNIINLDELANQTIVTLRDIDNLGHAYVEINNDIEDLRKEVNYSTFILLNTVLQNTSEIKLHSFYPGSTLKPNTINIKGLDNSRITIAKAKAMGFITGKII